MIDRTRIPSGGVALMVDDACWSPACWVRWCLPIGGRWSFTLAATGLPAAAGCSCRNAMIVAGMIVGASGSILTNLMG